MEGLDVPLLSSIVFCIILSAFFSSTETAFSSLNKIRLKNLVKNNVKGAALAYELSEQFDKVLSTILIGNNIVNIVSASLATVLFTKIMVGNESAAITVSTIVMTVTVLIFGEITPKTLAKEFPEKFAMFSAPILKFFIIILTPLNFPFTLWKRLLNKIFNFKEPQSVSDEELLTIVEDAEEKGGLNEYESSLICSAISFDDREVADIMTTRPDIETIDISFSMEEIRKFFYQHGFSRVPVCDGNIDRVMGFIHLQDFYQALHDGATSIEGIIKKIDDTVPTAKISALFRRLQKNNSHICIVVDEFGSTMGIVTVEDIIEELVGEIYDEHDEIIPDFLRIEDNVYTVLCAADINSFFENFNMKFEAENYNNIKTVGGWVIEKFGYVPQVGDNFTFENLVVTVSKTDFRRLLEIEVVIIKSK